MGLTDAFENQNYIICGDFNLVIDPYQNYIHVNNPSARDVVLEQIRGRSLIDPFRERYPDLQRYRWRKKMTRFDFFLITENILSNLKNCMVEPSY